jgi:hypothetical protein
MGTVGSLGGVAFFLRAAALALGFASALGAAVRVLPLGVTAARDVAGLEARRAGRRVLPDAFRWVTMSLAREDVPQKPP